MNEKLERLQGEINLINTRIEHLEGFIESERKTLTRVADRLRNEVKIVEDKYHNILYNKGSGLAFTVDRLVQAAAERNENHKWIRGIVAGLVVAVLGLLIQTFFIK